MSKKTKKASKVISSIAIGSMLLSSTAFAASPAPNVATNGAPKEDVSTHWAAKELQKWSSTGLLQGDANGHLNPNEDITRAEFITILNRVFNLQSTEGAKTFTDASPDDWYYEELQKASAAGLLNGDANNNANPKAPITRQEAATLISRGFQVVTGSTNTNFSDSSEIASWATDAVSALASKGFLTGRGNGEFDPQANITRAESFVMTDRVMGNLVRSQEELDKLASPIVGNVTIAFPGAIVKDLTITGDVYVTDDASTTPVVFDHTKVTGDVSLVGIKEVKLVASSITGTTNVAADVQHPTTLNVDADSSLNTLTLNKPASVTGAGSIETANIKSGGVTVEQQPAHVTVATGVTATVAGETVDSTTTGGNTGNPGDTGNPGGTVGTGGTGGTGESGNTTKVINLSIDLNSTEITRISPTGINLSKPIQWTTSDPYVAYVDTIGNSKGNYAGKVLGVTAGTAIITGVQGNTTIKASVTVDDSIQDTHLEKIVYYYNAGDSNIPADLSSTAWNTTNIPAAPEGKTFPSKNYVGYVDGGEGVQWLVSKDTLIKSTDKVKLGTDSHPVTTGIVSDAVTLYDPNLDEADQIQYLQGGRYIPQTGDDGQSINAKEVITNIMPDGNNGLWILGSTGNATHIVRKPMSLMAKSLVQEEISRNFADRFGFQSGSVNFKTPGDMLKAVMNADKGAGASIGDTDNDGLWTTMYASGEIWRYNYMKKTYGDDDARTQDAKASATRAIESIVTLGYISGMQLKVPSKDNVNDPSIYTVLGARTNGADEGKPVYVDSTTGNYTLTAAGNKPASAGFFARSYKVDGKNNGSTTAESKSFDTAWLQKKAGTTTDINGKTVSYSSPGAKHKDVPYSALLKAYDTVSVPSRLVQVFADLNGGKTEGNLDSSNVYYKASTSTDELVGHYFTLDLAYSAFKDSDPELAALIKNDMINHTNAMILNNYYQVSVTGENPVEDRFNPDSTVEYKSKGNGLNYPSVPTKWANLNPEFLDGVSNAWGRNDYEDGPLNATLALQMLVVAKDMGDYTEAERAALANQKVTVAKPLDYANELNVMNGDVPADPNAHNDYETRYPNTPFSTSLLDMSKQYLSRYFGISAHNGDGMGGNGVSYQAYMNYSDEEEAALSYYTLTTHAKDDHHAADILTGMNQWWYNEKREKNPFMTTFYAASLGALNKKGIDIGDPTVDLAGSTWQMTRLPNNFMNWDVLSANRNDVTHVTPDLMVDQLIPRDEVMMSKYNTNIFGTQDRRTIDSGFSPSMESSTVISMPYWLTMNPTDAANVSALGDAVTQPVNNGTDTLTYPLAESVTAKNPNGNYDEATHTFTINVGDSVKIDAVATGYIKGVSWLTDAWDQAGYIDGKPAPVNADPSKYQVIDLRDLAVYGEVGNVDASGISIENEHHGAYATGLKPGKVTVTAYVVDGFFRTPKKLTYTINVVDPNAGKVAADTTFNANNFAYPAWLKNVMAGQDLNKEGKPFVSVIYSSSSPEDGEVNPATGAITVKTGKGFNAIATVAYSDTTVNASEANPDAYDDLGARFEEDSHIMTFVYPVPTAAAISLSSTDITHLHPVGLDLAKPIQWTTSDPYVAYVDTIGNKPGNYAGKVLGVSEGTAIITGTQGAVTVTTTVNVTNNSLATNLEKIVYYYNEDDDQIPDFTSATLSTDPVEVPDGKTWPSVAYDGYAQGPDGEKWMLASDKKSVTLYDPNASNTLDEIQYLQGTRYIPATSPQTADLITSIMSDDNGGLWIQGASGGATHIVRKEMSLMAKTLLLDEVGRNVNDRLGFQSGTARFDSKEDMYAAVNGTKDQSDIARSLGSTDNDGLWTTMYGAGELYRYNYMKATYGANDARTKDALASATRSVESDLLLSFVSQRQLKVPAASNVNNTAIYDLLGANPDGTDEGKPVYLNADGTFTLKVTAKPAPDGFVARSYYAFDDAQYANTGYLATKLNDKERWMEIASGTTEDINGTEVNYAKPYDVSAFNANTYDYNSLKAYATVPVPQRLADKFDIAGKHIFYKDTTSTDEMIGHLYFLDMAYKTFKEVDPELASLAKTAITNVTNHIIINNYYFVGIAPQQKNGNPVVPLLPEYRKDLNGTPGAKYSAGYAASGNGLNVPSTPTRWSYYNPEYMDGNVNAWGLSDYEDASLGAILDLTMLQQGQNFVADSSIPLYTGAADGYKTAKIGIIDYLDEFNVLTTPSLYKARFPKVRNSNTIADVASQYHNRYFGISEHNGNGIGEDGNTFEDYLNYSDEEMAALGFAGLISSANANTTPALKQEYLKGLNQWWYNEKRTNNPFLSYFYAMSLGQLKALGVDVAGNQVDLAGADWQMHRMPSNFLNVSVSNAGRTDLTNELPSDDYDQLLPRDEVKTAKYNTNWLNPNTSRGDYSMEAPTGISLPYWLSVDPTNKALISSLGNSITSVSSRVTGDISIPSNLTQSLTLKVGEQLDLSVTGQENSYIKNISWSTDAWDDSTSAYQVVDLRTGQSTTNFDGKLYGSVVTARKAGTATVTAWTADGGAAAPRTVTYTITVEDPNAELPATDLTKVTLANFALPTWLTNAFANPAKNTDGNVWAKVEYSSSSPTDGTVDADGNVTYLTTTPFDVIATVTYSDMTLNDEPMFETDSHVITFVLHVQGEPTVPTP